MSNLVPHADDPERQRMYDYLIKRGWAFRPQTAEWVSPDNPSQFGRLEYESDYSRFWIQPPSTIGKAVINGVEFDNMPLRAEPLLVVEREQS